MRRPASALSSARMVVTAAELRWATLKNGDLIQSAKAAGFDLVLTADQKIICQQNLTQRKITLVVFGSAQ